MHPMWGVWGAGMMLMMLVFWGLLIVGIVLAIRRAVSQGRESRPPDAALVKSPPGNAQRVASAGIVLAARRRSLTGGLAVRHPLIALVA